jgi:hypothetical protein
MPSRPTTTRPEPRRRDDRAAIRLLPTGETPALMRATSTLSQRRRLEENPHQLVPDNPNGMRRTAPASRPSCRSRGRAPPEPGLRRLHRRAQTAVAAPRPDAASVTMAEVPSSKTVIPPCRSGREMYGPGPRSLMCHQPPPASVHTATGNRTGWMCKYARLGWGALRLPPDESWGRKCRQPFSARLTTLAVATRTRCQPVAVTPASRGAESASLVAS